MFRKLFFFLFGAPVLALLAAGCCANNSCNCQDLLADALYFSFDPTQFSRHEISTVYLARFTYDNPKVSLDSLPLAAKQRRTTLYQSASTSTYKGQDTTGLLVISNNAPFTPRTTGANLSRYFYKLSVPRDSVPGVFYKRPQYYQYVIDNINLIGQYQADGCCTCYRNTQKLARLSGGNYAAMPLILTEVSGYPIVTKLGK